MTRFFCSHLLHRAFGLCLGLLLATAAVAQQVVYNNTTNPLNYQISENTEFGSELLLAGSARSLTLLKFEYFGDFAAQGDERCVVRIYTNEKPYDLYRNEPTTVLYQSDSFAIQPGYNTVVLTNLNVPLRDVVTFTVEPSGLSQNEGIGLLLYNPPAVGRSFSELWRRAGDGKWHAVFYHFPDAGIKTKVSVHLTATNTVQLTRPKVGTGGRFEFGLNGMNGAEYILESSSDLVTWTVVERKDIAANYMVHRQTNTIQQQSAQGQKNLFYRVRVEK
jgi:hypothetical protein